MHQTAVVADDARIGNDTTIGPYAVVESDVEIGPECSIGPHAVIGEGTRLGAGCRVFPGACVGLIPQDLKFAGEKTRLYVGEKTTIRECVTINRGTQASGETRVGSNCLLMAYSHVAHDCVVGDGVILANCAAVAGHVQIGDYAIVGGLVPIHQFTRIGAHAFLAAGARPFMDVVPFAMVGAEPTRIAGINKVGLERRGFSAERRNAIGKAFRILFRKGLRLDQAAQTLQKRFPGNEDVAQIAAFVSASSRGILRTS
ncbi:MAG: acyl-ACP--UDP-N-acetylglucosamine O-acyltransferase [Chitinivibrionales bacterium]|nr:acyl-ACP--UDP-N-acetylglucosamine O-acyltransferase [Chitinivibrionales bacterium]